MKTDFYKQKFLKGILTSLSWDSSSKNADYLFEAPLITAGSLFTWLQKLGFDFTLQNLKDIAQKAREEVLFLPALGGLGAPFWNIRRALWKTHKKINLPENR